MTEPGKLKKTLKEASPIFTKDSKESMIVNLGSEKRDLSLVNESFSSNNLDFSLNNISENVGEPHLIKSWSSYENQVDSKEIKTKDHLSNGSKKISSKNNSFRLFSSTKNIKKLSDSDNENHKKNQRKLKNEKNLFQIKRVLAILKNWDEVCKSIPEPLQCAFKEKIKNYAQRKIFPNVFLETSPQNNFIEPMFDEFQIFQIKNDTERETNSFRNDWYEEKMNFNDEKNKNLFWENENNFNFDDNNFLDFEDDFRNQEIPFPELEKDYRT